MASGTPSAQVQFPLTGPFPPPTYAYTMLLQGEKLSGGGKNMPWQNNYKGASADGRRRKNFPGRARVGQHFEKKSHGSENCRPVPKIPHSIS